MKGCLAVIGGIVVLVLIVLIIAAVSTSNSGHYKTFDTASTQSSSLGNTADKCTIANKKEREAAAAANANEWQKAFDIATSGLHYNDQCSDDTDQLVNKGYLLSFRGTAEHYLHSGDWKTDLNEANATLVSCQTQPGLYGTHAGAQCETQENINIRNSTQWEIDAMNAENN